MRYAILSDIHGNLDALQAVLNELSGQAIDTYVCLGDIVGYGPQPVECLHEIQKYASNIVAGNHDYGAAEKISISSFNVIAKEAILWTRGQLKESDLEFLAGLPLQARLDSCHAVHGTLYAPELFDYVQSSYDAYLTMERMEAPLCFVGHSHVPVTFIQRATITYSLAPSFRVDPAGKAIVNVGSVGQPRDKDPRASYAVYDTQTSEVTIRRTPYDIDAVAGKIRDSGLPAVLGERLRTGR